MKKQSTSSCRQVNDSVDFPAVLLAIVDRELRHEFVNDIYSEYFERPPEQLVGTALQDLLSKDRFLQIKEGTRSALAGQVAGFETDIDFPSVGERRVQVSVLPRLKTNGSVDGFNIILIDITCYYHLRQSLDEQVAFEKLIAGISGRFVNLDPNRFDQEVNRTLAEIGGFMEVDRCFTFILDEVSAEHRVAHLWTFAENADDPVVIGTVVQQGFPWVGARMLRGEDIIINRLQDLPPEAGTELSYCRGIGIQSFLMCPMSSRDKIVGMIGFDVIRSERCWTEQDLRRLHLLGEIFANEIIRKENEQEILRLNEKVEAENLYLREEYKLKYSHDEIVGESAVIKRVLEKAEQVAKTESNVLIQGETGTGKELLARTIHKMSSRKDRALVTVNCAALSPTLIESELFGREKGAYTGAFNKQVGRFEIADGSTIFLDEVGELPLDLQAKLLRVLQNGEFERLGSPKTIRVDVRLIAATNRDLGQMTREGTFREDLYYRMNVFPVTLPSLRERADDIPLLVWTFIKEFEKPVGKRIEKVSKRSMQVLQAYAWPGNVRELRNVIERSMILSRGGTLKVDLGLMGAADVPKASGTLAEFEKDYIARVLEQTGWRVRGARGAAETLGLKPSTLESRMKKLGIQRP